MKLTWSAFALSDRDAIFTYIEADNPSAAVVVDERIAAAVRRLVDFPASGRIGRVAGTRELVIGGTRMLQPMPQRAQQSVFFASSTARRNGQTIYQVAKPQSQLLQQRVVGSTLIKSKTPVSTFSRGPLGLRAMTALRKLNLTSHLHRQIRSQRWRPCRSLLP